MQIWKYSMSPLKPLSSKCRVNRKSSNRIPVARRRSSIDRRHCQYRSCRRRLEAVRWRSYRPIYTSVTSIQTRSRQCKSSMPIKPSALKFLPHGSKPVEAARLVYLPTRWHRRKLLRQQEDIYISLLWLPVDNSIRWRGVVDYCHVMQNRSTVWHINRSATSWWCKVVETLRIHYSKDTRCIHTYVHIMGSSNMFMTRWICTQMYLTLQ